MRSHSQGKTLDELNKNLQGAIAILLEDGETARFEIRKRLVGHALNNDNFRHLIASKLCYGF